jgi:hypothetical protein
MSSIALGFNIDELWISMPLFALGGVFWGMSLFHSYRQGKVDVIVEQYRSMERVGLGKLHQFMLNEYMRRSAKQKDEEARQN